ncbi:DNA starvation/stationary phase protection protein [Flavobacterium plurextorum]|uniref:Dps family protein n=1 Tax=Flavobacterium TaxID=237 RepID=UPI00214D7AB2|nr:MULTISPECIES: DNA starvation/stationary phase protection protein [Flavobacterium]UUW07625.1 DNA starvation/stationary phase protection protein [Flavobacterium plurextorum]
MDTHIGIKNENRLAVAEILSKLLADEFILYTKTRNAHWNVEGPDFHSMHLFFEAQYNQLAELMDGVAERIRTIGHYAPGTLKEFLELTHLSEYSERKNNSQGFIKDLLADHQSIVEFIRGGINTIDDKYKDPGTSDYLTGFIEIHEKMAWMLRAHLNG